MKPENSCSFVLIRGSQLIVRRQLFTSLSILAVDSSCFQADLLAEFARAPNPDAITLALEGRRVDIVGKDFFDLSECLRALIFREIKLGELDAGTRVGMLVDDSLPNGNRAVDLANGGQRLGQGHHRIAIFVLGIFGDNAFEQRQTFGSSFRAEQALAEMGTGVDVGGVAFHGRAITAFGFVEFALLKINVAELGVMMRLVEMMNLRLEFFDPFAVVSAGQLEAARGGGRTAIDVKEIPEGAEAGESKDKERPNPFAPANRIDQHPDLEDAQDPCHRRMEPVKKLAQGKEHGKRV